MSNAIFPVLPGLALGSGWTPSFSTKIQTAVSGKEYRTSLMANPIYKIGLSFNFLRHGARPELRALLGFFLARRGAYDNFLYDHPTDNAVTDQLIGVADGRTAAFQLLRSFGSEFVEPVQNVKQIVNLKVNGVPKTLGADYTVSATGMVVLNAAPSVGNVTWSGGYYYRARFADDEMDLEKFLNNIWKTGKVQLVASLGVKI